MDGGACSSACLCSVHWRNTQEHSKWSSTLSGEPRGHDILPRDRSRYQDAKSLLLFTMRRWGLAAQRPLLDQGSFPCPHTSRNYPESKRRWCPQGLSGVDSHSKDPSTASANSDGVCVGDAWVLTCISLASEPGTFPRFSNGREITFPPFYLGAHLVQCGAA